MGPLPREAKGGRIAKGEKKEEKGGEEKGEFCPSRF